MDLQFLCHVMQKEWAHDFFFIVVPCIFFFFFSRRYNPWWVLACFMILFHNLLSLHFSLQFLTFIFFKSSSTWSNSSLLILTFTTDSVLNVLGIPNNAFKAILVQKFSRIKGHIMHWLSIFFNMEAKFWPLRKKKRIKAIDVNRNEIFRKNSRVHPFGPQKKWRNFGKFESRNSWQESKEIQIKLAATCNKNEQQQDAKNNAVL